MLDHVRRFGLSALITGLFDPASKFSTQFRECQPMLWGVRTGEAGDLVWIVIDVVTYYVMG
jgi:hypothetical protein